MRFLSKALLAGLVSSLAWSFPLFVPASDAPTAPAEASVCDYVPWWPGCF